MSSPKTPYWFPAKRYGWGWGLPARWEGWVVLVAWMVAVMALAPVVVRHGIVWLYVFMVPMMAVLFAICYAKGEPPRWRWGK